MLESNSAQYGNLLNISSAFHFITTSIEPAFFRGTLKRYFKQQCFFANPIAFWTVKVKPLYFFTFLNNFYLTFAEKETFVSKMMTRDFSNWWNFVMWKSSFVLTIFLGLTEICEIKWRLINTKSRSNIKWKWM